MGGYDAGGGVGECLGCVDRVGADGRREAVGRVVLDCGSRGRVEPPVLLTGIGQGRELVDVFKTVPSSEAIIINRHGL